MNYLTGCAYTLVAKMNYLTGCAYTLVAKMNYLTGCAYTLVAKIDNTGHIWEKLINVFGSTQLLLQNK